MQSIQPELAIYYLLHSYQHTAVIAHRFGVSYQATVYRLRSLNYISMQECENLIAKYPKGKTFLKALNLLADLENKEGKELYKRELIAEIAYSAIEAYRRHEISRGRVFELGEQLGIGGEVLYELAVASLDSKN